MSHTSAKGVGHIKKKKKEKVPKKYKLSWKKLSYFKDLLHELNNRIDEEIYKKKWLK